MVAFRPISEPLLPIGRAPTQIIYHKSKSISASMGKFIEVIEEHIMGY
ncbi:MAG: hypothetical protein RR838_04230 [Clostridium sp.]